jgi:iron complex outermembrane receptor protein
MILFLFLILGGNPLAAPDPVVVRGQVSDQVTELPLSYATLLFKGKTDTLGVITDIRGNYLIEITPGWYDVEIRHIGYQTELRRIECRRDTTLNVAMRPRVTETDEIVVQEKRQTQQSGLSRQVLEGVELERSRGQTLGETISGMVGVDLLQTGSSIAKPVVRGLHSDRVITMQAGVPMEGQQWGGEHAPEIDPFSTGVIEVIKGASGVEYGIGAIGGVIKVNPRDIDFTQLLGGQVHLQAFSNNRQLAGSVNLEGSPTQDQRFMWRVQGSARRAGSSHTPDYEITNSGFQEWSANTTLGFRWKLLTSRLYASTYAADLGLYTGAHFGSPADLQRAIDYGRPYVNLPFSYSIAPPKQAIRHHLLSFETRLMLQNAGVLSAHVGLQQNHRREYDAHGRFGRDLTKPAFDLTLTTQTLDVRFEHLPVYRLDGRWGIQVKRQGNVRERGAGFLIPDFRSYSLALHALEYLRWETFTIETGARLDYHWTRVFSVRSPAVEGGSQDWIQPTGIVSAVWQPQIGVRVSATMGMAWRPPGVHERYSRGVHHGSAQYEIGDPLLGPERSMNLDLGLEWDRDTYGIHAHVFQNRISDFIQLRPDGIILSTIRGAFPVYRYTAHQALIRGLELSSHADLTKWYTLSAKMSLIRGFDRTQKNGGVMEPLYMMPPPKMVVLQEVSLPDYRWFTASSLQLSLSHVSRQRKYPALVSTEAYREPAPPKAYTLTEISWQTTLFTKTIPIKVAFEVDNLLDVRYRDYLSRYRFLIDESGRNVQVRLSYSF